MAGFRLKKIDVLLVKAFIGPFLATFLLSSLVFLLQFLWKYVDELIGKGLEIQVILEFLFYAFFKEIFSVAMPMAILLASIMTYGNLGEKLELVAIRSAGILLRRLLYSIGTIAFFFSSINFVILNQLSPVLTLKWIALYYDIHNQKPTFELQEGVFYKGLDGYAIKIGKKDKDGKTIHNVLIYDETKKMGNINVITAKRGEIEKSADERYLFITLHEGTHYEELKENPEYSQRYLHNSMQFERYRISFDMLQFNMNRTSLDMFRDGERFKDMEAIEKALDSLSFALQVKKYETVLQLRSNYHIDSVKRPVYLKDSVAIKRMSRNDSNYRYSLQQGIQISRDQKSIVEFNYQKIKDIREAIARHEIEWHRKITYSLACVVLFLIGAPLGAIVRRGGFGMPVVIAIGFFILYYILNIIGEKVSKQLVVPASIGMWFPVAVLTPIAVWLVVKSSKDRGLFNFEWIARIKRFFLRRRNTRKYQHETGDAQQ